MCENASGLIKRMERFRRILLSIADKVTVERI